MKMFGTNGIRGVANEYLDADLALRMGRAIAKVLGPGPIAIARDTRISSQMLVSAVSAGIMSMGADVVDLGMLPTPALQMFVKRAEDVTGGVMITASHNPPKFNGIKCISADGTECSKEQESAMEEWYEKGCETCGWDSIGCMESITGADMAYIDSILSNVNVPAIKDAKLKVCLDCANGASVHTSPAILEMLDVEFDVINGEPDGMFPGHESEPTEDNLSELKERMATGRYDLGIAHDGDADRCVFVDRNGRYVPGDRMLALLSKRAVQFYEGGIVVTGVSSSMAVQDAVESAGGTVDYTAVGSPIIARRMMEIDGVFGGEENGGLIFADHQYCRDGGMALAKVLEAVAKYGPLDEQLAEIPEYCTIKDAVMCDDAVKATIVPKVMASVKDGRVNTLDGLRVDYDDGWVLLRPSGTEPKFRIYSESKDRAVAERRAKEFRALVEAANRARTRRYKVKTKRTFFK